MAVIIGSARQDENGNLKGGKAGDQTGNEVSLQNFYVHSKGWYILRAKDATVAKKLSDAMKWACGNNNIGYDQSNRLSIINNGGIGATKKVECDCSSLVRACIIYAAGVDVGNFTTANEASVLVASGLFDKSSYTSSTTLYDGDILVSKKKSHTVIVTEGAETTYATSSDYSLEAFIRDVQRAIGANVDGIAGNETLSKTPTVSCQINYTHAVVKFIQTRLNTLGYDCGTVDGIAGTKFNKAVVAFQKANGCTADGVITAKAKTWKKLLGMA